MNVFDSFIGIFSGVTLLVNLHLAKCNIRFFGLRFTALKAECITSGIPCDCWCYAITKGMHSDF